MTEHEEGGGGKKQWAVGEEGRLKDNYRGGERFLRFPEVSAHYVVAVSRPYFSLLVLSSLIASLEKSHRHINTCRGRFDTDVW